MIRRGFILPLLALPALCACQAGSPDGAAPPAPPSAASLDAVTRSPGANRAGVARAIDAIFAEETGETRALVVLHDGRIIAERYGVGFGAETRQLGWSLGKTLTGIVIGMLIADGSLALDQPAPIPAWQRVGDPRGEITVRHLLQMRSGLRHAEGADPPWRGDTIRMAFLEGRRDWAGYAETQPLDHAPGTLFAYSTASSMVLADIATRALTRSADPARRHAAMQAYLQERLFGPAGMGSALAEYDAAGTMGGGGLIHMTARDWAKLGELLRNRGAAAGVQIVPRGWIAFMRAPSPTNPAYGAHLWIAGQRRPDGSVALPDLPAGSFAALGSGGQQVLVVPSKGLTLVRLGATAAGREQALDHAMAGLVAQFPGD